MENLDNRAGAFGERIVARAARVVRAPHEYIIFTSAKFTTTNGREDLLEIPLTDVIT